MRTVLYTIFFFCIGMSVIGGIVFEGARHPQTADLVAAIFAVFMVCVIVGCIAWAIADSITE